MIIKSEGIAEKLEAEEKTKDPLIITPTPDLTELREKGSASIDMRLGTWFLSLRQAKISLHELDDVHASPVDSKLTKMNYVPFGDGYILHPRSFVLGITLEWIRIPRDLAGYVIGKSSLGRRGLIIATATGFHPGFTGTLTLELTNVGEVPIKLQPGMKICQLFLHKVETHTDDIDCSGFIGRRKPSLGTIVIDDFSRKLAGKYNSRATVP